MTEDERKLVEHFGIRMETETVYIYQSYKYLNLVDALNYARRTTEGGSGLARLSSSAPAECLVPSQSSSGIERK